MYPKIIVMITMLAMPDGGSGVHVKPFSTVSGCIEAANIEVADPLVAHVECAELDDGVLTLRFDRESTKMEEADSPTTLGARD
ncbi:MAG: hypothetical protein ACM31O_07035 [Bacteroidota bacterium]|jgi:hypothetical protein|nr:hypothetical protein [Hyphomicrobiaceae bacterium]